MIQETQDLNQVQAGEADPDLIIEGGIVITMVEGQEPVVDASVYVSNGRIADIRVPSDQEPPFETPTEIIDAKDAIIMPGLVNTHNHAAMTLFRGLADDMIMKEWLFKKIFPAEANFLSPETVYWGSLLGCLEMIASGTTTFADGYFFQDDTIRAVHESGLRALIAQGVIDFPAPGVDDPKKNLQKAREFIERWLGFSELITPGVFCHSPLTCSGRTLKGAWEISRRFDLPLQIHLSETSEEVNEIIEKTGERPAQYLDQLGLIDQGLIAAHAVHLDNKEMECLREKGANIVHAPESNMKLCSGVARISEMVKMGLTVGLGTDGCSSNNNLDLFCEMDTAAKLSKVFDLDPIGLDAKTVLKMATTWGASLLGLGKQVGTLVKGKKADIIVVDLHSPHMCPIYDPISSVVYSANGADVRDVIVNGKVLMKDRKFMTLDPIRIMEKVRGISKKIS
ncbi:MAG: amidohydrolase [Thermodesulfobacteriota bacterium]|nr:amidohydrolase [Thermodesulfobacteriota bacterium]